LLTDFKFLSAQSDKSIIQALEKGDNPVEQLFIYRNPGIASLRKVKRRDIGNFSKIYDSFEVVLELVFLRVKSLPLQHDSARY
jgi:hypothetical protein